MYKVIRYFTDLQDNGHPYGVGDEFPRAGKQVSAERLRELSSANNLQKTPLIELIPEQVKEAPKKKAVKKEEKEC